MREDGAEDHAGGDADEQELATIIADVMVAARGMTHAVTMVVVHDDVAVAVIAWQTIAAAPLAVRRAIIRIVVRRRRAVIPLATVLVAIVAAIVPAIGAAAIAIAIAIMAAIVTVVAAIIAVPAPIVVTVSTAIVVG